MNARFKSDLKAQKDERQAFKMMGPDFEMHLNANERQSSLLGLSRPEFPEPALRSSFWWQWDDPGLA